MPCTASFIFADYLCGNSYLIDTHPTSPTRLVRHDPVDALHTQLVQTPTRRRGDSMQHSDTPVIMLRTCIHALTSFMHSLCARSVLSYASSSARHSHTAVEVNNLQVLRDQSFTPDAHPQNQFHGELFLVIAHYGQNFSHRVTKKLNRSGLRREPDKIRESGS